MGRDPDELGDDEPVHEAVRLIGEEEPAILEDAELGQVDLVGVLEAETADRRDGEADGVGMGGC